MYVFARCIDVHIGACIMCVFGFVLVSVGRVVHICIYAMYLYECIYMRDAVVYIYIYISMCMYVYMHTHTYTYMYRYIDIHMCIYIRTYLYKHTLV